ncbi:MAG: FYDLN acid domain-containing protein [Oscillospiraceae bacterium]|nr:FYDLN acid domain-containing protein [Oscillospiraceae bacterium]
MAKHACPNCGKWFDYEFNSWVCPKCGTVVTGDMEKYQIRREAAGEIQRKHKETPTVRDYDRKHGTGEYKARKVAFRIIIAAVTLTIMSVVALMVVKTDKDASYHKPEPTTVSSGELETEEYTYSTEETEPKTEPASEIVITEIDVTSAAVGEPIKMGGYDLTVTEVFEPDWRELPVIEGWKYIAVSFEKTDENGYEMYGFNGKDAYASLYDKNEGAYLMPLYESDIISYEDDETDLYMSYDMISGLSYGSGTILFLVKETSSEFELSVFEGEGTSYSDYDINAERRIVIPVTINEQEVSTQP